MNAALELYNDEDFEIIEGVKFMSPAANLSHGGIITRLCMGIGGYCEEHNDCGRIFVDDIDVHLPDGNCFKPDFTVVLKENAKILNWKGNINGVPDMVVEVLSKSTMKKDLTIKKDVYERNGVKVYWIVNPFVKSVTVYLLRDGKYILDDEYIYFDDEEFAQLDDKEKAEVKFEVPVHLFEGLNLKLEYLFKWCSW